MATATAPSTSATSIAGKILVKETRKGIADLLVELFDLDAWADPETGQGEQAPDPMAILRDPVAFIGRDIANLYKLGKRVGSTVTDASGTFSVVIGPRDLTVARRAEQRPDLVLLVLAPDEPGLTP